MCGLAQGHDDDPIAVLWENADGAISNAVDVSRFWSDGVAISVGNLAWEAAERMELNPRGGDGYRYATTLSRGGRAIAPNLAATDALQPGGRHRLLLIPAELADRRAGRVETDPGPPNGTIWEPGGHRVCTRTGAGREGGWSLPAKYVASSLLSWFC